MRAIQFDTILIANRGEIACRIIRTAKRLGYQTVAIYSDADASAPHTRLADQAVHIGPAPAAESYLNMDKIIQAAKASGAQAVHPGYGFLSENAEFAAACLSSDLVFIGPASDAIDLMGNKAAAKRRMQDAGVPCVPGYQGGDQSDENLLRQAQKIGVPIMVKAAAGGGGRGMRLVESLDDVAAAINQARSEAENAFGSGELILEKAICDPRHVEVQIFADQFGHTIHLGERDCSVQRRHQKVIEEAPCPILSPVQREQMGEAAIAAAKSIHYFGAATVEFLLDTAGQFYFLEMNTRLQVEHPVTEMITGLDLVALQLQVAQGEPLGIEQADVSFHGHAIEVRLYAEDPTQNFLPAAGKIETWYPAMAEGLRVDDGIRSGLSISPYYDPMIAKVIAWGANREEARRRLSKGLDRTVLFGINNNKAFLNQCLNNRIFIEGQANTSFIATQFSDERRLSSTPSLLQCLCAAVIDVHLESQYWLQASISLAAPLMRWSSAEALQSQREYVLAGDHWHFSLYPQEEGYDVVENTSAETHRVRILSLSDHRAKLEVNRECFELNFYVTEAGGISLDFGPQVFHFLDNIRLSSMSENASSSGRIVAPMHGQVQRVVVELGQHVKAGESLVILEAMKMQHAITASVDGKIVALPVAEGAQVATDQVLVELEP